jgi:hypothetical protein
LSSAVFRRINSMRGGNAAVGWAKAPQTTPNGVKAANAAPCQRADGQREPCR